MPCWCFCLNEAVCGTPIQTIEIKKIASHAIDIDADLHHAENTAIDTRNSGSRAKTDEQHVSLLLRIKELKSYDLNTVILHYNNTLAYRIVSSRLRSYDRYYYGKKMRQLNPSIYFLPLGILLLLTTACKEPVNEMEPAIKVTPSLQQETRLELDGVTCIDDIDITSCFDGTSSGSGTHTGLSTSETNYLFHSNYTLLKESPCFSRPLRLKLLWSGPKPPSTFDYTLSNVDELLRNSNAHRFMVQVSVHDAENREHYSHRWDLSDVTPIAIDPSATSAFTYSITDTICDLRETSTLILSGSYEGYVYNSTRRPTDSFQIKLNVKDMIIGNRYY